MSYCYDTLEKAWAFLRRELPAEMRDSELADRFEFLLLEMHEANHRLKDAINHDGRVTKSARRLDNVLDELKCRYVVVENAGHEGEQDVRSFTSAKAAYAWGEKQYGSRQNDDSEWYTLHVGVRRDSTANGVGDDSEYV